MKAVLCHANIQDTVLPTRTSQDLYTLTRKKILVCVCVAAVSPQCVYGECEPQLECCRTIHLSGKETEEKRAATELKRSPSSSSLLLFLLSPFPGAAHVL